MRQIAIFADFLWSTNITMRTAGGELERAISQLGFKGALING
jgi:hypothetical protein